MMPKRLILDFAQRCNLRCGFCPLWGKDRHAKEGVMDVSAALRVLDQFDTPPVVAPMWYGEPLMMPEVRTVLSELKRRGCTVNLNTNGLLLDTSMAAFLVDTKVDAVMVSLDAATPETLKQVRGVRTLSRIEAGVMRLLVARGDSGLPRIGVSFTIQEANRHELSAFEKRWIGAVDVVRIGYEYRDGTFPDMPTPEKRTPCPLLYETMVIRHDGTVPICCLDSQCQERMGNAFTDGVAKVWNGDRFNAIRKAHEEGRYNAFCANCNGWADKQYTEETRDGLLVRRSPQYVFYNRLDRVLS